MTHIDEILDAHDRKHLPSWRTAMHWISVLAAEVRRLRTIIEAQITTQANLTDKIVASREREKRLVEALSFYIPNPGGRRSLSRHDQKAQALIDAYNQTDGKEE